MSRILETAPRKGLDTQRLRGEAKISMFLVDGMEPRLLMTFRFSTFCLNNGPKKWELKGQSKGDIGTQLVVTIKPCIFLGASTNNKKDSTKSLNTIMMAAVGVEFSLLEMRQVKELSIKQLCSWMHTYMSLEVLMVQSLMIFTEYSWHHQSTQKQIKQIRLKKAGFNPLNRQQPPNKYMMKSISTHYQCIHGAKRFKTV